MFAGVVLAYQQTAGVTQCTQWEASRAVCDGIKSPDFPYTDGQLRQWARRNDKAARKYAEQFLQDAAKIEAEVPGRYSETERILIAGREALFPLLVIPS
jgi:hypothetical protein